MCVIWRGQWWEQRDWCRLVGRPCRCKAALKLGAARLATGRHRPARGSCRPCKHDVRWAVLQTNRAAEFNKMAATKLLPLSQSMRTKPAAGLSHYKMFRLACTTPGSLTARVPTSACSASGAVLRRCTPAASPAKACCQSRTMMAAAAASSVSCWDGWDALAPAAALALACHCCARRACDCLSSCLHPC